MTPRLFSVLAFVLALAACASPTPYRAAGPGNGYGFSEQLIDRTRFRVSFRSNSVTPRAVAENYALLRAAELTLAQGGDWFIVTPRDVSYDRGGYDDGPIGTGVGIGGGSRGVGGGIGIGIPLGMDGPDSRTVSLEIVIQHGAKPANAPDAYDARAVRQALGLRG